MERFPLPIRIAALPSFLGKPEPAVILEIGCNDGSHSREFLKNFPRLHLHCFEPDARPLGRFSSNVNANDIRCELHRYAIGDFDGPATFYLSGGKPPGGRDWPTDDWDLSSSLRRPTGHLKTVPWCVFNREVQVEVKRLDTWLSERSPIDTIHFIWADIQGAEGDLVRGAPRTLARTQFLYTEFSDRELYEGQPDLSQLCDMLPDFEPLAIYQDNVLFRHRHLTGPCAPPPA